MRPTVARNASGPGGSANSAPGPVAPPIEEVARHDHRTDAAPRARSVTAGRQFADRHGLEGQALLVDEWIEPNQVTGVAQRWAITVVTQAGAILQEEVVTDGSRIPCPFDVALSWFAYSDYAPHEPEYVEMVDALGHEAVADLLASYT